METSKGKILEFREDGTALIVVPVPNIETVLKQGCKEAFVLFEDGRRITPAQMKKAHVLIKFIAEWMGEWPDAVKRLLKADFRRKHLETVAASMADWTETQAREFITDEIALIVENQIPCGQPLYEMAEDVGRYVYACLMSKSCCVCGRKADLHHVDAVGMGNNREKVHHLGRRCLPLCREHHIELHARGDADFMERYHLASVEIDTAICKKYGLKK